LPGRELRAGLAEVIKHAAIADAGFFAWLEDNMERLLEFEPEVLAYAIQRCCEIKAAVVVEDETEQGRRALLNFGHTFAHAIENALGYGQWLHGEAVAAGMIMAADLSDIDSGQRERLRRLIDAAGLPVAPPEVSGSQLLASMQLDKKARAGKLRFVLLDEIGSARVRSDWSEARLQKILNRTVSV
jgi:3-dehydroquinate synthase